MTKIHYSLYGIDLNTQESMQTYVATEDKYVRATYMIKKFVGRKIYFAKVRISS